MAENFADETRYLDGSAEAVKERALDWLEFITPSSRLGRFESGERESWYRGIFDIYSRMKDRSSKGPYAVDCRGMRITVLPDVYAPHFFTDSAWFATELPNVVGDASLLEIGTGTGVIAIACAKEGARVVATDLNPKAVENARLNVQNLKVDISVRLGDLYRPIGPSEKFDYIFWAHPFNNWPVPVSDILLRSGLDYRYESLAGYISGARQHLKPDGRLLLGTGDSADLAKISEIARSNAYAMSLLRSVRTSLEECGTARIEYLLFEFSEI